MSDVLDSLKIIVLGLGIFIGVLLLLYFLSSKLPRNIRETSRVVLFVGPALLLLFAGLVVPAIRTVYFSFFGNQGGKDFKGFDNFVNIFTTQSTRTSVVNTLLWVVLGTVFATGLGLAIARFADGLKGERVAKAMIFLPTAISLAGAGIIWKFVYAGPPTKTGLLNAVTKAIPGWPNKFGGDGQRLWLSDPSPQKLNTLLLIVILVWVQTGFATVVFSAAIKGVPESLTEAARVDGATERQVFFKVVAPYIRATIVTVVTTTVIAALKVFDIVKASTGGNFKTSTIANDVYDKYFITGQVGYGSALAVLLFLLVVPVVIVNQRSQRRAREMF